MYGFICELTSVLQSCSQQTPGFRARNDKLEFACQKYLDENLTEDLENLVKLTKDLFDVDRNSLYYYLLQAHCNLQNHNSKFLFELG